MTKTVSRIEAESMFLATRTSCHMAGVLRHFGGTPPTKGPINGGNLGKAIFTECHAWVVLRQLRLTRQALLGEQEIERAISNGSPDFGSPSEHGKSQRAQHGDPR
jgi:hypothetical protein